MIYTELVLVILNAFNVTLTLPGIAGIILGIGMAVDANVIIFARVKEEMARGKSVPPIRMVDARFSASSNVKFPVM